MAVIMQTIGAQHSAILSLGVYRPRRIVGNVGVGQRIGSSDEWIQQRSGIKCRRFAASDETIVAMAAAATRDALGSARIAANQVGAVIVATSTHELATPGAAPLVATEIGAEGSAAFDISAGCAGFGHGLAIASDLVHGGTAEYVVVVGAERLTDAMDPTDRATALLFGDGGGPAVVGLADVAGVGPTVWGSDGSRYEAIRQTKQWTAFFREVEKVGTSAVRPYITMNGRAVFRWAAHSLGRVCREAIDRAGVSIEEIRSLIPHQANGRIIDIMARVLGLSKDCAVARDIETSGNLRCIGSLSDGTTAVLGKSDCR